MVAETEPEQMAEADAADAAPVAADPADAQQNSALPQPAAPEAAPEPLRSVPDSLTKVLQDASFEATPLSANEAGSGQQSQQQQGPAEAAEQPADAADRKRRRLGRRYARAAKQWRKLTRQQQQQPDAQPAATFRTAPMTGIRAGQCTAAEAGAQHSALADAQQGAQTPSHAADIMADSASQPLPSPDDSQRRMLPSTADHQRQQQSSQDTSPAEARQPQALAAPSNVQAAEAPAGWGLQQEPAAAADAAAAEAAATAARQQQALQRAEELRVTDTLQPPPPMHESLSRTSSGRVKVGNRKQICCACLLQALRPASRDVPLQCL